MPLDLKFRIWPCYCHVGSPNLLLEPGKSNLAANHNWPNRLAVAYHELIPGPRFDIRTLQLDIRLLPGNVPLFTTFPFLFTKENEIKELSKDNIVEEKDTKEKMPTYHIHGDIGEELSAAGLPDLKENANCPALEDIVVV
ncbi:hypothetical protein V6N13_035598 [Hibiscus sabdariffa]|uniref:Uncharacterized protein n=1 Tax=Hibiscus sabdariffa TaxID=183260 RepID=A0ABR2S9Q9_9ROSI